MSDDSLKDISNKINNMLPKIGYTSYATASDFYDKSSYGSNLELELKEHPMKNEIEYKILEFLKENDNGKLIDLPLDLGTVNLLKQKTSELRKRDFIKSKPYPGYASVGKAVIRGMNKPPKCMITMSGKEYLLNIENSISNIDNSVTYNLSNNKNTQLNHESDFLNSPTMINDSPAPSKKDDSWFRSFTKNNPFLLGIILTALAIVIGILINNS